MANLETVGWRRIAEQASTEMDSTKLMALVRELCREFDKDYQATAVSIDALGPASSSTVKM
jgi:hypothetical protein